MVTRPKRTRRNTLAGARDWIEERYENRYCGVIPCHDLTPPISVRDMASFFADSVQWDGIFCNASLEVCEKFHEWMNDHGWQ